MAVRTAGNMPVRKIRAAGLGGAVATIIVWILNQWVLVDEPMQGEVAASLATVCSFAAGYVMRPGAGESIVEDL